MIVCMQAKIEMSAVQPPRLISAIGSGFNTVTNNVQIILLPVLIDLLLWFGPHMRLKVLGQPFVAEMTANLGKLSTPEMKGLLSDTQKMWEIIFDRFNILSTLRTYPIGVPSLMVSLSPLHTPLGEAPIREVMSTWQAVGFWVLFSILGITLGVWYFNAINQAISGVGRKFSMTDMRWELAQSLLLVVILLGMLLVISIPIVLILSVFSIINATLAQIFLLVISIILIWLLLPMVFSPHGIFSFHQTAFRSIFVSLQLVRRYLPGTGLFMLTLLLISQGLDTLWRVPPETSWMALVGVFGHALVSTALLTASFVYYRGGVQWMEAVQKITTTIQAKA